MRHVLLILAIAWSIGGFAETAPSKAAAPQPKVPATKPVRKKMSRACHLLLSKLKATDPNREQQDKLLEYKRNLEDSLDRDAFEHDQILRDQQAQSVANYEGVLFILAGGGKSASNQILGVLRPIAHDLWDSYSTLVDLAGKMEAIKKREQPGQPLSEADTSEWQNLSYSYEAASRIFGENYGTYMSTMSLLKSVAAGNGAGDLYGAVPALDVQATGTQLNPVVKQELVIVKAAAKAEDSTKKDDSNADKGDSKKAKKTDKNNKTEKDDDSDEAKDTTTTPPVPIPPYYMVYNLKTPAAISAARSVLAILNPEIETRWFASRKEIGRLPGQDELHTMFSHNIYALIAKLEKDLKDQREKNVWWRRLLNVGVDAWLNTTDRLLPSFTIKGTTIGVPESVRKFLLALAGIKYDQLMLQRHLPRIQEIVEVARVRTTDGNIVLLTDSERMELQLVKLQEFIANATGNDLLVTFARLNYHASTWTNLMRYVKAKADETGGYSNTYKDLYTRMQDAEKSRKSLGYLPYLSKVTNTDHLLFLSLQAAYSLGIEEYTTGGFLSTHGWQLLQSIIH